MHPIMPKAAWLTVNRSCNFRCTWCYARDDHYNVTSDMPLDLAMKLIDLMVESEMKNVLLIGGEPTLWSNLLKINNYCKIKGIQTILVTNALRFSDDGFWKEYLDSPNDAVGISLKAGTPDLLAKITGVKRFDMMRKGIERAVDKFKTGLSITYNHHYRGHLPDMAKFAIDCGARSVKIDFCTVSFVNGIATNQDMINPVDVVSDVVGCYDELNKITGGNLTFEMQMPLCVWPQEFIESLKSKQQILSVCHVLSRNGLVFDTNAKIMICNGLFDYPVGEYGKDFIDAKSLNDFLNGHKIMSCYDKLACYPSRECETCIMYNECGGGCPLKWAIYNPQEIIKGFKDSKK